jgi:hypothetical protein
MLLIGCYNVSTSVFEGHVIRSYSVLSTHESHESRRFKIISKIGDESKKLICTLNKTNSEKRKETTKRDERTIGVLKEPL